jgi:hypothetical protein
MTMKIEVTIPEDDIKKGVAATYLAEALSALGFSRTAPYLRDTGWQEPTPAQPTNLRMSDEDEAEQKAEAVAATEAMQADAPKRERGKPAPGKARRTKEEIAEDEAADKADAEAAPETKPLISTGAERIDPTHPEDAAQDAADEAAEAEATKAPELTHDDVRAALKKYVDAYGMPAAMEDGPKVFKMLFGDKAVKVSDVPTDQASLRQAIDGIGEMTRKNPFSRTVNL